MFAVIKTGGKQYRVAADDIVKIEKLAGEAGDMVEFADVLMVGDGASSTVGSPTVEGAMVTAEVVEQGRARKIIVFKKRRRKNSRRTIGHRQHATTVRISEILTGGAKPKKTAAKKPAAKPADDKAAKPEAKKAEAKKPAAKKEAAKADDKKPAPKKEAAKPEAKKPEAKPAAAKADVVDDIALIGGVGPALKKKLEGAGITSLKQISTMSKADMAKLDEELSLGGRMEREEWKAQAKELLAGKPPRAKVDQKAAKDSK